MGGRVFGILAVGMGFCLQVVQCAPSELVSVGTWWELLSNRQHILATINYDSCSTTLDLHRDLATDISPDNGAIPSNLPPSYARFLC